MSIKDDLYTYLINDSGIAAAVSDRVYPLTAPTSAALPYITLQRISCPHVHHMGAASGLCDSRFQIDCWAENSVDAETASEAVREALDGYQHSTMENTDVRAVFLEDESDTYEPPDDASEVGVFRNRMDFIIWYAESIPTFA